MDCTPLQASTGSDSGVAQLQAGELRTVLGLYRRHRVSVTSIISGDKAER